MIRNVELTDAPAITAIYNEYVKNTTITFETEEVSLNEMCQRIVEVKANNPYFVYEDNGRIVGYAYVHQWKTRAAYAKTKEVTIYIDSSYRRKGIGNELLTNLINACRTQGTHVLIACITEGNQPSVALHEKHGFKQVAFYPEVGWKMNKWVGVSDYELILE